MTGRERDPVERRDFVDTAAGTFSFRAVEDFIARNETLADRVQELEAALRDATALIEKSTYNPPGWTGTDVWWKQEADQVVAVARAALRAEGSGSGT